MKKVLAVAAFLLLGVSAFAQWHFGAGFKYEYAPQFVDGKKSLTYDMSGVYAGASYNIEITNFGLSLAPGAYVSFVTGTGRDIDGKKEVYRSSVGWLRNGSRHFSLMIPVHAVYSMDLGPGKAFAYAGPALECGMDFRSWSKGYNDLDGHYKTVSDNYYSKKGYDWRVLDLKMDIGFGYQWKFLQANVGFDWGLIDKDPSQSYTLHVHGIHIGAAYVF